MEEPFTSSIMCVPDAIPVSSTTSGAIEISEHSDNQWVPQDTDANLTFDLLEPAKKGQLEDDSGGIDTLVGGNGTEGSVEGRLDSPSQKAPNKLTLFTRPVSSHVDLASGFSFTKPKPAQPLSFGSRSNYTTPTALLSIAKAPTPESLRSQVPLVSPLAQDNGGANGTPKDEGQKTHEVDEDVTSKFLAVPFPLVLGSTAKEDPHLHAQSEASVRRQASIMSKDQDSSQPGRSKPFDSGEGKITDATFIDHCERSSNTQKVEAISNGDQPSRSSDYHGRSSMCYNKTATEKAPGSNARIPSWLKSQDDVIHMLMFNRQRHSQEFQRMVTIQKAQKEEVAELLGIKDDLNRELQHVYKRLEEKEIESRGREDLKTKVQARLRKFTDFLNNLSENHSQLRDTGYRIADDTQELRMEHKKSQVDLQKTKEAMSMTQEAITRERTSWMKELLRDEGQAKLVEQQVQNIQEKLQQEQTISRNEQARSHRLEESINQVSNCCGQLMSAFKDHHDEISRHINRVLDDSTHQPSSIPAAIDPIPVLGKCVQLLEALRDRDTLQPVDLHRFEELAKEDTKVILSSIKSCESIVLEKADVSQRMAQQMDDSQKTELQQLSRIVIAEQPRHEQITELRETKAAIQARLQAAEVALQDARMESALLKTREEGNFHRIASLENQISQMQIPPATVAVQPEEYFRLHDLETHNRDLAQQSTTLETEVAALSNQLQQKNRDMETANVQLSSLQLQLEEARARHATMQEQQSSLQEQLVVQSRQITEELSHIASLERRNLKEELTDTQVQLEQVRSSAKVSLSQTLEEINVQIAKNVKLDKELAEQKGRLHAADAELHKERNQKLLLQEKVTSLEQDVRDALRKQNDKDKEIINLKAMLGQPRMFREPANKQVPPENSYHESLAVDEDAQVEEIPRDEENFAEVWGKYLDGEAPETIETQPPLAGSKSVSEETMRKLLASTPEGLCDAAKGPEKFSANRQLAIYQRRGEIREIRQVEDSQSQDTKDPVIMSHKSGHQDSSITNSDNSSNARDSCSGLVLDDVTAQNTAINAQGPKSNTKIARKRNVTTADLAGPDEPRGVKKLTRSSSRIRGSIVIADSQSSGHIPAQTNRPARLSATTTTQKKSSRAGLYQKEFDKHLRP